LQLTPERDGDKKKMLSKTYYLRRAPEVTQETEIYFSALPTAVQVPGTFGGVWQERNARGKLCFNT